VTTSGASGRSGRSAASDASGSSGTPTGIRFLSSGASDDGFARAIAPRPFEFPDDHAAHPRFRTEWWYFTGNLADAGGGHYGFELTFFRYALAAEPPDSRSAWSTNQVWMAHLAVTDTRNGRLIAEERLTRGALGLAGTALEPFRVWVEDWSVTATAGEEEAVGRTSGGQNALPAEAEDGGGALRLVAAGERIALDLELVPLKSHVTHGDDGLDPKGPEPGNASYYYSLTRIAASGTVGVDGEEDEVEGYAWMDREWSTSALSPDLEGWDWFALQLSDGRELMVYRLRRTDGTASPFSGGSLVAADGRREALDADAFDLEVLDEWESERSDVRYPVAWRLTIADAALDLELRPYVEDQEIDLSVRYWEGAVRVEGTSAGQPVGGSGYLELAGY